MSMYDIAKCMVYKFAVHYIVYSKLLTLTNLQVFKFTVHCIVKLLSLTSLEVYSTLHSLHEIVATYKSLTNQRAIKLLYCR